MNGTTACKWDSVIPFNDYVLITIRNKEKVFYEKDFIIYYFQHGYTYKEAKEYFEKNKKEGMWKRLKLLRKEKTSVVLFGSEPFSSKLRMSNIKEFKYDWIWNKNNASGFVSAKKRPLKNHEIISVFYKKQCLYNPQFENYAESTKKRFKDGQFVNRSKQVKSSTNQIYNGTSYKGLDPISLKRGSYPKTVQFFKNVPNCNNIRLHSAQKPIESIEYLIKTYTNECDLVLDFAMGSGTTGVACINLNRKFIGIEKDVNYFSVAKDRINKAIEDKNKENHIKEK